MTSTPQAIPLREILGTRPNPNQETDYVVLLGGNVRPRGAAAPLGLALRYVPDRLIVEIGDWQRYLVALSAQDMVAPEELAARIISDVNNEVVPRWLSVVVSDDASSASHKVFVEDRQPNWDNSDLLGRIPSV